MHKPIVKHTLNIFKLLTEKLPPLVPKNYEDEARDVYVKYCVKYDLSLVELETYMIECGKKLWPYRKSFEEFYNIHEHILGEKFLLGKLPLDLKKHYHDFKYYGGTLKDLYHGGSAHFFSVEERNELSALLVKVREDVHRHTVQAVVTNDRAHYEKRIEWFKKVLVDIETRLHALRVLAEHEMEHLGLISEINEQIRAFEHGLCLLGPAHDYQEIINAEEHFLGRKKDKSFSFV